MEDRNVADCRRAGRGFWRPGRPHRDAGRRSGPSGAAGAGVDAGRSRRHGPGGCVRAHREHDPPPAQGARRGRSRRPGSGDRALPPRRRPDRPRSARRGSPRTPPLARGTGAARRRDRRVRQPRDPCRQRGADRRSRAIGETVAVRRRNRGAGADPRLGDGQDAPRPGRRSDRRGGRAGDARSASPSGRCPIRRTSSPSWKRSAVAGGRSTTASAIPACAPSPWRYRMPAGRPLPWPFRDPRSGSPTNDSPPWSRCSSRRSVAGHRSAAPRSRRAQPLPPAHSACCRGGTPRVAHRRA